MAKNTAFNAAIAAIPNILSKGQLDTGNFEATTDQRHAYYLYLDGIEFCILSFIGIENGLDIAVRVYDKDGITKHSANGSLTGPEVLQSPDFTTTITNAVIAVFNLIPNGDR